MARRTTRAQRPQRSNNRTRNTGNSNTTRNIVIGVIALFVVGGVLWWIFHKPTNFTFNRAILAEYVTETSGRTGLSPETDVYIDMSDGMNFAYSSSESKQYLQNVINKLAANKGVDFFELSAGEISPHQKSHTELYNYILNPSNYDKQQAPIQKTLDKIVDGDKSALLMTDFEEYNGQSIEKAAYAKEAFIKWLEKGNLIVFYKWDFVEKGKEKHMFLAVFDDNSCKLNQLVKQAIGDSFDVDSYVLGGHGFSYPLLIGYPSNTQGGNYHNKEGVDIVTSVGESGGAEDYICFAQSQASANGNGAYTDLSNLIGAAAEYYPIGVTWEQAVKGATQQADPTVPAADRFKHLLSKLYVNFEAQDGYEIEGVEVRVFNMMPTMEKMAEEMQKNKINIEAVENVKKPQIFDFLTISTEECCDPQYDDWTEIFIDFDKKFNGSFSGDVNPTDLLRANVTISKAVAKIDDAMDFFGWNDNLSLANSVKETLEARTSNPEGEIIHSYYLKTFGK